MTQITFKKNPVHTSGNLPTIGKKAPDFTLTNTSLEDVHLNQFQKKKKLLNIYISIDTGVCATSTQKFHSLCNERDDLVVLNIAMDLPFAFTRFCEAHHLKNTQTLSCFRSSFAQDYGVKIVDGPLKGLCARCVIVLDEDNHVLYTELVSEISHEPDYEKALEAL